MIFIIDFFRLFYSIPMKAYSTKASEQDQESVLVSRVVIILNLPCDKTDVYPLDLYT
jgi:hypothetical protein